MEIHFNTEEEEAIKRYAKLNKMTYEKALRKIINAMQKGLMEINGEKDIPLDGSSTDPDNT